MKNGCIEKPISVFFKTDEDRQWAIQYFGLPAEKCMTLPYGVEKPVKNTAAGALIRERHQLRNEEKILLFAGTLDYTPNAKAVENIYSQIAPLLDNNNIDYKIIICGRNRFPSFQYLKKLSHPSVIYAGEVEDIETYFSAADLFINPVQDSGGIQTKNIDALSYGLPVVCFRNVMAGLEASLCPGKVFEAAENDWNDFTDAITRAIHAPFTETPSSFFTHYSFAAQAEKLAARLISL